MRQGFLGFYYYKAIVSIALACTVSSMVSCTSVENSLNDLKEASLPIELKTVTIRLSDYCPAERKSLKNFFVVNESAKIRQDNIYMDWDRDGLDNLLDSSTELDLNSKAYDTNGDGYSDMIVFALGLTYKQQAQLRFCDDVTLDFDGDGLTDCEEYLLHTESKNWDTDGDGIPDKLELRTGLNPLDVRDAAQDTDSDGISNMEEVRRGTPIGETNTARMNAMAWVTELESYKKMNLTCYNLIITNMPVLEASNGNLVRVTLIEEELPATAGTPPIRRMKDHVVTVPRGIEDKSIIRNLFSDVAN